MKLHLFIVYLGTGIVTVAFLISLVFMPSKKPQYFRYIFYFIFLGGVISINTIAYFQLGRKNTFFTEQVLIILQTLSLYYLFSKVLNNHFLKQKIVIPILAIIHFSILAVTNSNAHFNINRILGAVILIVLSIVYYKNLLNSKPSIIIHKSSAFWMITGIFFLFV